MSDFNGMEELLQDFLTESTELLSDVDNKLIELEKKPDDFSLLNDIFRGFHTIKGGAGFLNVLPLVTLCHRTENLFDKLRNKELQLSTSLMDVIMDSTGSVREMFDYLAQKRTPPEPDPNLIASLDAALRGEAGSAKTQEEPKAQENKAPKQENKEASQENQGKEPNWQELYSAVSGSSQQSNEVKKEEKVEAKVEQAPANLTKAEPVKAPVPAAAPRPAPQKTMVTPATQENTIRIDTQRLDQVLNLSGEIGLTRNRLTTLRTEILSGKSDQNTLRALDEAVSQLDLLVGDLQNAVMKTRMQPIGRLFQKYPRLVRDLARQLGKEVELVISGEETEVDKTMIEDLNDPLVHLVRNAIDHGVESPKERLAAGKAPKSLVELSALQVGDHVIIEIADDGKGMNPELLRSKAVQKGLIDMETANGIDDKQALQLIFLPGFSTKEQISSVSGRGVGMDVVKTNIQKLNGRIDIQSSLGAGTRLNISLPLTLAILPVLVVRVCNQAFAVPLAMVREIIQIQKDSIQEISGRPTIVVRDEILPVRPLADLLCWPKTQEPTFGVLMQSTEKSFILAIDSFVGRDDVVIKPLQNIRPKGVAGATLSGDGSVVLVLDMEDLLSNKSGSESLPNPSQLLLESS